MLLLIKTWIFEQVKITGHKEQHCRYLISDNRGAVISVSSISKTKLCIPFCASGAVICYDFWTCSMILCSFSECFTDDTDQRKNTQARSRAAMRSTSTKKRRPWKSFVNFNPGVCLQSSGQRSWKRSRPKGNKSATTTRHFNARTKIANIVRVARSLMSHL